MKCPVLRKWKDSVPKQIDCKLLPERANLSLELIKRHSKDKALHFARQLLKVFFICQLLMFV